MKNKYIKNGEVFGLMNKKLVYKVVLIFSIFLIAFSSLGVTTAHAASSFYEGQGISRAKCTLRKTYTPSQLKTMGNAYSRNAIKIGAVGTVAGLTPIIGKGLAAGAALIAAHSGLKGNTLTTKGSQGYSAREYYCEKVKWDGYSPRSYVKLTIAK